MEKEAKFRIKDLISIGITFVVIAVVLSYGVKINSTLSDNLGSTESAILSNSTAAMSTLAENIPLIATIAVAAIIVGIIISQMASKIGGRT